MVTAAVFLCVVVLGLVDLPAESLDFTGHDVVGCDKQFVSGRNVKNGSFSSPAMSENYEGGDITCKYSFIGEDHERVQIIFNEMRLNPFRGSTPRSLPHFLQQSNSYCDDVDSVTVTVYLSGQPRDIGIYCEDKRPPMLMSIDNHLEVTFIRRSHSFGRGFLAHYKFVNDFGIKAGERSNGKVCQFEFKSQNTPNGTFTSPNFPGLYPRNAECHYLFYGQNNERIYITFPYFDVEGVAPKCDEDTESDYVEFSNFNVQLIDRKMNRLCGTKAYNIKNDVNSDGNFFRVTFKSNHIYDATGFEAFYQFRRMDDPYAAPKRPSRAPRCSTDSFLTCLLAFSAVMLNILFTTNN